MPWLHGIHANLVDRPQEAKEQGWLGEVAAIETTIATATQKLETMHALATQPSTTHLRCPVSVQPLEGQAPAAVPQHRPHVCR
jgi:hypothetical protein